MSSSRMRLVSLVMASGALAALGGRATAGPSPIAHRTLDEASPGTVVDETGNHNGTNNGATVNQPGQVGTRPVPPSPPLAAAQTAP